MASRAAALGAALALSGCAGTNLPRFERALASRESATLALQEWCEALGIAQPARIVAERVHGKDASPPAGLSRLLGTDTPGYRHVRLSCGGAILSEAHNWYVPARLTPEMNRVLDTSDTPFGKVVAPLGFRREMLQSRRGRGEGCPAGTVLSNRALLRMADGRPLALVIECYTQANLAR